MDAFWAAYVDGAEQLADPLVAPLRADLTGLPPALLAIAACAILADCNHAFTAKLEAAIVPLDEAGQPLRGPDGKEVAIETTITVL